MKKLILCSFVTLLTACNADLSQFTNVDSNASTSTKMKACLITEANSRLQNGTLFNNSITATAKEMVTNCIQNLSLQAVGVSNESQTMAENIIQNLKNITNN